MLRTRHEYATRLDRNNTSFTLQLFEHFKKTTWGHEYDFLKYYQNVVRSFVTTVDLDSRGLLIYHTMGLGKSILATSIAMDLIKERQPIVLLTKSLQENMREAIRKYVKMRKETEPNYPIGRLSDNELNDWTDKNFSFVSMNASNMLKQMGKAAEGHSADEFDAALEKKFGEVLKLPTLDGKLLIVDEAHNLFRAITNGSKNAQGLYDMVMKAKNLKVMFLTGTPIANDPFELVPCFNMIGSKTGRSILPDGYKDFNRLYVDEKNGRIKNKEKFQNRILGLVSHVSHLSKPGRALGVTDPATKAEFPEELPIVVEKVHMDYDQYVMYQLARDKEKEEGSAAGKFGPSRGISEAPSLTKPKSHAASTYRVKSRQLSNFCPPNGMRDEKDPSKIPSSALVSAKYRKIYENIQKRDGQLGIVYSQFVGVGGLGTFARYLETQGWEQYTLASKKSENPLLDLEPAAPGEQGELDEYVADSTDRTDRTDSTNSTDSTDSTDRTDRSAFKNSRYGPAIPKSDEFLLELESELHNWWQSDAAASTLPKDQFADFDRRRFGSHEPNIKFRYATAGDIALVKSLNPAYKHAAENMIYPNRILLVSENDKTVGYVIARFDIEEDQCGVKIIDSYFSGNTCTSADIMKKLMMDMSICSDDVGKFKQAVWGSAERKKIYAIISGEVPIEDRAQIQNIFNQESNAHGGIIDMILLSSTGAEGLDLKNVRHIHIMEPYWNYGRLKQIIARGVRNDSHKMLPQNEKNVQPYVYLSIPPESERLSTGNFPPTTDTELYDESILNQLVIESFHEALREVSIECVSNGEEYCRMCNPTNQQLFTDDPNRDIRAADPCKSMKEEQITAQEIIVDGEKYYFTEDTSSIFEYRIFAFDQNINGFRQMKESDPKYQKIVDAINENK